MDKQISSGTAVFGYLMPAGSETGLVFLYSRYLRDDPSSVVVPLGARQECLESAVHNVRTGLVPGMLVDQAFYTSLFGHVDAVTPAANESGVIDTLYADPVKGVVVGDCAAVQAVRYMTSFLGSFDDPIVLMYGNGWETRVAMTALSGSVTLMHLSCSPDKKLDAINTGCVVEYVSDMDPEPYDLLVGPPTGLREVGGQSRIWLTPSGGQSAKTSARFEALRLAVSMRMFRGIPATMDVQAADNYEKNY